MSKRFILNNVGLSDKSGIIKYKDYGKNSGVNTLLTSADFSDGYLNYELLEGIIDTGNSYCQKNGIKNIDFLKIDVEGAEHLVLYGFSELLDRQDIRIIQFEYGYTNGDAHFLMKDFYNFFEKLGYKVGKIRRAGIDFSPFTYRNNDFNSGPNYIAVKENDNEIISLLSKSLANKKMSVTEFMRHGNTVKSGLRNE